MKPTRNWRLRDRRPIAALASRRKAAPAARFPERKSAAGGRRRRREGERWPRHRSGTKMAGGEAGQAWLLLLLRKKGRDKQGEWSSPLLEIMNRSRLIARFSFFFYPFSCLVILL